MKVAASHTILDLFLMYGTICQAFKRHLPHIVGKHSSVSAWPDNDFDASTNTTTLWKNWRSIAVGVGIGATLTFGALTIPTLYEFESDTSSKSIESTKVTAPVILFQDILSDLERDYIDKIDTEKLFKTGMQAMLQSLDPYTEFEDLKAARAVQESVSGRYGGVGLVIGGRKTALPPSLPKLPPTTKIETLEVEKQTGVTVIDAFEGYAYDANLRPGDVLLEVDGIDCSTMRVDQVRELLRGDPDTPVRLRFRRQDFRTGLEGKVMESTVQRQLIHLSDVRLATLLGSPEEGIGYINLAGFNAGAGRDFRTAMLTLRSAAPDDLKGLILDLRGNPGGLLDMAVEVASYLVPEGSEIVSARGKTGPTIVYQSSAAPIRPEGMKLVLLVNKASASASEIVAGAVQDLDAGVIVGPSSTFGKGLVQKIIPLPYDAALKYTIARYYTPSGRCIQSVRYTGGRDNTVADAGDTVSPGEVTPFGRNRGKSSSGRDSGDAVQVRSEERSEFRTRFKHRTVRDQGGIEPDFVVPQPPLSLSEGVLLSQGVYGDFAKDYVRVHNVRRDMRAAAVTERIFRNTDPTYTVVHSIPGSLSVQQFYVPPQQVSGAAANAAAAIAHESERLMAGKQRFQIPFRESNEVGSTDSTAMRRSHPVEKAPDRLFWGRTRSAAERDRLFQEFKAFVQRQLNLGEVRIDLAFQADMQRLESTMHDAGITDTTTVLRSLRPRLRDLFFADLAAHRENIVGTVEQAILSLELSDRVLLLHGLQRDPQVAVATQLVQGGDLPSSGERAEKGTAVTFSYKDLLSEPLEGREVGTF